MKKSSIYRELNVDMYIDVYKNVQSNYFHWKILIEVQYNMYKSDGYIRNAL